MKKLLTIALLLAAIAATAQTYTLIDIKFGEQPAQEVTGSIAITPTTLTLKIDSANYDWEVLAVKDFDKSGQVFLLKDSSTANVWRLKRSSFNSIHTLIFQGPETRYQIRATLFVFRDKMGK